MTENSFKSVYDAPIGKMIIISDGEAIIEIDHINHDESITSNADELCQLATKQLDEYFAGTRIEFKLPLKAIKGTEFQKAAWQALTTIPYGETISYGEQARRMNNPKAVRAVGGANGKNPFSIVVPCHRVIGANGALTGYTGGMSRKEWLLDFERSVLDKANK